MCTQILINHARRQTDTHACSHIRALSLATARDLGSLGGRRRKDVWTRWLEWGQILTSKVARKRIGKRSGCAIGVNWRRPDRSTAVAFTCSSALGSFRSRGQSGRVSAAVHRRTGRKRWPPCSSHRRKDQAHLHTHTLAHAHTHACAHTSAFTVAFTRSLTDALAHTIGASHTFNAVVVVLVVVVDGCERAGYFRFASGRDGSSFPRTTLAHGVRTFCFR